MIALFLQFSVITVGGGILGYNTGVYSGMAIGLLSRLSFYGNSFVELNMTEASSQNFLQLRFRTSKPHGLLFLAAGKNDYCLMELCSGSLQVWFIIVQRSQLNDLDWHLVELHHEHDNVTLVIDNHDRTSAKMPGILYELNIDYGFYLGGTNKLDVPYLVEAVPGFRGCIDDVLFNQLDILMPLRPSPGFKNVHEVLVGCSDEFFAGEDEPISFFSSRSYVSFPSWNVDDEGILEYTLQTSAARGLLLYHPGQAGDFIAMEIEDGLIKAYVGKHKSRAQLSSRRSVNDSHWHYVELKFTAGYLQLTLDEEIVKKSLPPHSKLPLLKGSLFVGGVDDSTRSDVIKLELISVSGKYARGGSFKGCLRDLKANSEKKSLKNVLVTKDISAGCETESAFNTNLSLEVPVKNATVKAAPTFAISPESPLSLGKEDKSHLLVLSNLVVLEGGQASLESEHIKVNLDFQKLGIHQSQILFEIKEPPSHGDLKLGVEPAQEVNTFTMQDVWQGKVLYVHDGSEGTYDYFNFSISASSEKIVAPYLQGNEQHVFSITVTPVNDAPEITLPKGNLLLLIENSKKRLSSDLIKVLDRDTDTVDLCLSVLGNLNADAGFLENSKHPGKAITTFSNEDLREGTVFFVHTGVKNSRIVLRASDGEKVSNTVVLRVMAVPLNYRIVNNSGIKLLQGVTALITPRHLAVETNASLQELEIRYEITEAPQFGEVQRQHSRGEWKQVNSFSQRSVQRSRVRYCSTYKEIQLENVTDQFKFKVSIGNRMSEEHVFPIKVKWLRYSLLKHTPLEIEKSKNNYLNSDNLFAVLVGVEIPEDELHFKLLTLPKHGQILLNDQPLKKDSVFSQKDITDQKVAYELISRYHEDNRDSFRFLISTKYLESTLYDFEVYIKSDFRNIILTNNGLTVTEGEGELITSTKLFVRTLDKKTFQYKVTQFPKHGKLKLINFSGSFESNDNLTTFTNTDITDKRLIYVHDDSETVFDEFLVRASSEDPEVEPLSVEIKFNISVQLKNDEKPVRVIDKIFNIVRNGQRLLTLADLCYHDPDLDFDDGQLLYTRRGISNGDLVLTNDTLHRLYQFKQVDLEQKQVLFIHHGADFGRFVLFVTDGKHYTSSLLEVNATDPYVRLANNTGLLIQKGKEEALTTANLSAITNQDIRSDHELTYEILSFPKYGRIYVNNLLMDSFTQLDLIKGYVTYRHDDSNNLIDMFNFTVHARDAHLDAGVHVRIYLESHQWPPRIVNKNNLLVEEGKPVKISKGKLQVVHENSSPSEIVFTVRQLPVHGYIRKFSSEESYLGADQRPVLSFTQQDVDEGKVQYVQTVSDQLDDRFSLDVTNGVQTVSGIEISVDIIPRMIPLEVQNFTVIEGGSKALVEDYLKISSRHFAGLSCEFILIEQPKHGYVENSHVPGIKLTTFTRKQVMHLDLILFSFLLGAIVQEGGRVLINKTNLDASNLLIKLPEVQRSMYEVWYQVVCLPQHGMIVAGERNVTKEKPNFSQYILNKFGIVYIHDNSESLNDNFTFAVWLNLKSKSATKPHSEVLEEMFNITVVPVNDQAPELKTKRLHLKVLQGDVSVLGSENLKVEDLDNAPDELKYTIVSNPNNGYLAMKSNLTVSIKDFTQADIDSGKVWFVQDGSSSSGVFYFSVTDGKHRPLYKLFSLEVIPITLVLVNRTNVALPQGQTSVTITNMQLSAVTNGKSTNIMYEITQPLKYGHLMIGNEQVTKFEQADLYAGSLSYHLTNLTASREVLEFMLFTAEGNLTGQVLNITVKPLLQVVPDMQISNQAAYKFRSSDLDASELANLTNSNPRFEVIVPPSHGRIVKKRFVNDAVFEDIQTFTQTDIDNGVVLLDINTNMTGIDLLNDSFTFILRADAVQPAVGCFQYSIVPYSPPLVQGFTTEVPSITSMTTLKIHTTSKGKTPASSENEEPAVAPRKTESTMWPGQNHWGNIHEEGPLLNLTMGTSGSARIKTTNQVNARSPREQAGESSNPWYIIIPLVLVSVLLIVAVISVCVMLMCQKKEKTKVLVRSQTDTVLSSPDRCIERSLTVPSVTVTPLLKGAERSAPSTLIRVRHEQLLPAVASPTVERPLQNSWLNLDPEMIQYCRKTNPTLKRNQYWV
uniref:Laminin G domain-containing protein n=1 Tax=Athene cunicularia TaxID=194338 RepID=A0A663N7L5_ATHCN